MADTPLIDGNRSLPPPITSSGQLSEGSPWGFWMTLAMSMVIFASITVSQLILSFAYGMYARATMTQEEWSEFINTAQWNGSFASISIALVTLIGGAWILLFVVLRKNLPVREYLALRPVRTMPVLGWMASVIALGWAIDIVTMFVDRPVVPDYMVKLYSTAGFLPLFWFMLVFVSPVFEEMFYRGFVYAGVAHSSIGVPGAIIAGTAVNCLLLYRYDYFLIATYIPFGLLAGYARHRTDSLYTCLAMRITWNFVSMLYVSIYLMNNPEQTAG